MDAPRIIVLSTSKKAAAAGSGSGSGSGSAAAAATASPALLGSSSLPRCQNRRMGPSLVNPSARSLAAVPDRDRPPPGLPRPRRAARAARRGSADRAPRRSPAAGPAPPPARRSFARFSKAAPLRAPVPNTLLPGKRSGGAAGYGPASERWTVHCRWRPRPPIINDLVRRSRRRAARPAAVAGRASVAQVGREHARQRPDGAVLQRLDRPRLLAHDQRGLGDRQPVQEPQHDALLLLRP